MAPNNEIQAVEDWTQVNDDPLGFKNDHNGKVVGLEYYPRDEVWQVRGPNSTLYTEGTYEQAKERLLGYVRETYRPNGMV